MQRSHLSPSQTPPVGYSHSNLTGLQFLYWTGQKLRPSSSLFNTILVFTLHGVVDPTRFQAAFQQVAQASDALRTVIQEVTGVPQRCVLPTPPEELVYLDFSLEACPRHTLQTWLEVHRVRPLSLDHCLFDTALIRVAADEFVWYINQHHLINDATSEFLLFRQVVACYEAGGTAVPQLPQFEQYVAHKQMYELSSRSSKAATFWQEKLCQPLPPLSFYGNRPLKKTQAIQRIPFPLGLARSQQLRAAAIQSATTPEMALFNTCASLLFAHLHYLTGNHDLAYLISIHNRPTVPLKNTLGLLMEVCPLRLQLTEGETFISLRQKVSAEMRQVLIHYPYGSHMMLQNSSIDVMFNFNYRPALTFAGKPVEQEEMHPGAGSNSLALQVHEFAETGEFVFYFDFHQDVFTPAQQQQAVEQFKQLLDGFLEDANQPIGRFASPAATRIELSETPPHPAFLPPHDEVEARLQQVWQTVLGMESVGVQDNFFDLGGQSWQAMNLFVEVEKATGHYLPISTLLEANTIEGMAHKIRQQTRPSSQVVIQEGKQGERPLFCIPGAAGNSLVFARIAPSLAPERPVFTFLPPGLADGQQALSRVEDMAAYYIQAVQAIQPQGPYLLVGYSAGGAIAFEMAQQWLAQGQKIALLAILDMPMQSRHLTHIRQLAQAVAAIGHLAPEKETELFLSWRDWLWRVNYQVRRGFWDWARGQVGQLIHGKQMKTAVPAHHPVPARYEQGAQLEDLYVRNVFLATSHAVRTYIPKPYPGRVVLLRAILGGGRPEVRSPYADFGWGGVAKGGVEVYEIPVHGHLALVHEPYVAQVGQHLQRCLEATG